jgi:hypothetical protein
MTGLLYENWSGYGGDPALMLDGIFANNRGCAFKPDPDATATGTVLQPNWDGADNGHETWRFPLPHGAQDVVGWGARVWIETLPESNDWNTPLVIWGDLGNNNLALLSVTSTGALQVVFNDNSTHVTPAPVITAGSWYHIEAKCTSAIGSPWTVEVRVEGVSQMIATGPVSTAQVGQLRAWWDQLTQPPSFYLKDFIVWDGEGAANTDFYGPVEIFSQVPASDVALNWVPSTGSAGWSLLNVAPPNDANFLEAPDPRPSPWRGTLTPPPANATNVAGAILRYRAWKASGGEAKVQAGVISGATPAAGALRAATTTPTFWQDSYDVDPEDGSNWSVAALTNVNVTLNASDS